MSFLTRTSTTTLRTLRFTPRAAFSTSVRIQKSVLDPVKDAAKTVDRTVSDAAVKGIEKGRTLYSSHSARFSAPHFTSLFLVSPHFSLPFSTFFTTQSWL